MNQAASEASGVRPADSPPGRGAFVFIFITVLLDMLALGIIIPVLPKLVVGFMGGDTAGGAEILGLFGTAWALMQFLFTPVLGALSDRFGRRPVILISYLGLGARLHPDGARADARVAVRWTHHFRHHGASFATGFAYIADVTPPEKRAARFGLLGVAFGAGFILGPGASAALPAASTRACRSGSRRASASPTASMAC